MKPGAESMLADARSAGIDTVWIAVDIDTKGLGRNAVASATAFSSLRDAEEFSRGISARRRRNSGKPRFCTVLFESELVKPGPG